MEEGVADAAEGFRLLGTPLGHVDSVVCRLDHVAKSRQPFSKVAAFAYLQTCLAVLLHCAMAHWLLTRGSSGVFFNIFVVLPPISRNPISVVVTDMCLLALISLVEASALLSWHTVLPFSVNDGGVCKLLRRPMRQIVLALQNMFCFALILEASASAFRPCRNPSCFLDELCQKKCVVTGYMFVFPSKFFEVVKP